MTTPRFVSRGAPLTIMARPPCGCSRRSGLEHALAWWPSSPQLKHLRLDSSRRGFVQSRVLCLPPQLPHLASRSPVRGGVGADLGWNWGCAFVLSLGWNRPLGARLKGCRNHSPACRAARRMGSDCSGDMPLKSASRTPSGHWSSSP